MMENYKGIMLCSRPQDQINLDQNRPFISRVHHDEPCGYNPVYKFAMQRALKRTKPVLRKHKLWLDEYSMKMKQKFKSQDNIEVTKQKNQSQLKKEKQSEQVDGTNQIEKSQTVLDLQQQKSQQQQPQLQQQSKEPNQTSKKKPQWALSESQLIEQEDQELEALIDFAKGLDYDSYINDLEVKVMLEALKVRVQEIKGNEEERIKILAQPRHYDTESQQKQQTQNVEVKQEKSSKRTKFADEEREDWDKSTTIQEQKISVEERLAKYIAEEILKKNKHLRGLHSKLSLRRVLEMEAQSQLVGQNINT